MLLIFIKQGEKHMSMMKWLISFVLSFGLLVGCSQTDKFYIWCSLFMLIVIMLPFYIQFEKKAFVSREIVIVAVLAAIAAVSRFQFSIIPSVQPTSFVIIVSAIVFGSETGFIIGATAALVSNIFLGQGPRGYRGKCFHGG